MLRQTLLRRLGADRWRRLAYLNHYRPHRPDPKPDQDHAGQARDPDGEAVGQLEAGKRDATAKCHSPEEQAQSYPSDHRKCSSETGRGRQAKPCEQGREGQDRHRVGDGQNKGCGDGCRQIAGRDFGRVAGGLGWKLS